MRNAEYREMIVALGRYVKETRLLLGWSQEGLADQARASQGMISRIERGRCVDLPFLSIMKVLSALATVVPDIDGAVPPPFRLVLACAAALPRAPEPLPDPHLAELLQTYHALPAAQRATFLEMLRPLAVMLEGQGADAITTE